MTNNLSNISITRIGKTRVKGETHKALILPSIFLISFLFIVLTLNLISAWNFQGEFASVNINVSYYNSSGVFVPYVNAVDNVNLNDKNMTGVDYFVGNYLSIKSNATIGEGLIIKSGGLNVSSNLNVTGQVDLYKNLTVSHKTTTKSLNVTDNLYTYGNLIVYGNMSVKRPYGMFSDMKIQTLASTNTAYNLTFNTTEDAWEIDKNINNYTFSVQQNGDYLIVLSIIAQSTSPGSRVYIWARINNVDVPRSTTIYDFKSNAANAVIAVPFILDLETTDTFSINWAGDNTGIRIISFNKTAFAPETPGPIMTITKLSEVTD